MLVEILSAFSGLMATTYGHGEAMCGEAGEVAKICDESAVTATGTKLLASLPIVAISLPTRKRLHAQWIEARLEDGECTWLLLADKKNERFYYQAVTDLNADAKVWDLTPAALIKLGAKPHKAWSGRLYLCTDE